MTHDSRTFAERMMTPVRCEKEAGGARYYIRVGPSSSAIHIAGLSETQCDLVDKALCFAMHQAVRNTQAAFREAAGIDTALAAAASAKEVK